ncbi:hypothetical protein N2152v2_002255 [Parachlorella kessleri]
MSAFIANLAAVLKARSTSTKKWKLDAVTGALEKAVAVVPEGPAKELLQSNLSQCAAELLSLLVPRADAAADEEGSKEKAAGGRKRAKKATTAAADPASDPLALVFDSAYDAAVAAQCSQCQPDPQLTSPLALAFARCPPPAPLLAHSLGLVSSPAAAEGLSAEGLAVAERALGVCASLAALAPSAAEGAACFAELTVWLSEAAAALQETSAAGGVDGGGSRGSAAPQQAQRQQQLWVQLGLVVNRLMASLEILLRRHRQQGTLESSDSMAAQQGGAWCLARLHQHQQQGQAEGDTGTPAGEAVLPLARRTCAQAVTLRAACRSASVAADRASSAVAAAAHDLAQLAPFGPPGLAELLAGVAAGTEEASAEAAGLNLRLCRALVQQQAASPADFLLRLAVARRAASACHTVQTAATTKNATADALASAGALAREADALLGRLAQAPAPAGLESALRRQPPSAVVAAALAAAREGGPRGLSAYLVKGPSVQVLLALARKVAETEDGVLQHSQQGMSAEPAAAAAGPAEAAGGDGADELLFFVSTDADATMFGRDWAADEDSSSEEDDGEAEEQGTQGPGVRLGELSDDDEQAARASGSDTERVNGGGADMDSD